jgi:cell division septum initiation protein DivIVA
MSNVAQRGVHTCDRWHPEDRPRDGSSRAADSRKGSALQAEIDRMQRQMQQERQRMQRAVEVDARAAAAVAEVVDQVQAAAPQQGTTRRDVQGA